MRTSAWVTILGLAGLAVACGDQPTEVVPDREDRASRGQGTVTLATSNSGDGYSISTDKDDYQPGDTLYLTGAGWEPGDVLGIVLNDEPQTHAPHEWTVTVEGDGTFHDSTYVVDEGDLDVRFTLIATSQTSGQSLTVNFTDANISNNLAISPASISVAPGSSANYTVSVPFGGNTTPCTASLSVPLPSGVTGAPSPASVTGASDNTPKTSALNLTVGAGVAPGTYTLTVTATPGSGCTGSNRTGTATLIVFGPATHLGIGQGPSTTQATTAITPAVTVNVLDANNNIVASSAASITMAIGTNAGGGTLSGTLTQAAVNGVATFPGLSIDKAGNGYTLRATSGSLTAAVSGNFNVTVGAAAQLQFVQQPSDGTAGVALTTQPKVVVTDAGGNIRTSGAGSNSAITLTVTPGTGSGVVTCTTNPLAAANGTATFGGCKISLPGTNYQLRATSGALTSADSDPFDIVSADADAPIVNCTVPNPNLWYGANVNVPCTASDASGLANPSADASFTLSTSVGPDNETATAGTGSRSVCDALTNCVTIGPYSFKVDRKAPEVTCGSADGNWHASDATIHCTSIDGGSGVTPGGEGFDLTTSVPANTETANAATGSQSVTDLVGNSATAGPISGNKVDKKAPAVSCDAADGIWHGDDVSIHCTATDGGSGVATGGASFDLTTNVAAGNETANAQTGDREVTDVVGNSATAGPIGGNQVDKKAPQFTCEAAPAAWSAADVTRDCIAVDGGSGVAPLSDGTFSLHTSVSAGAETATAQTDSKQLADAVGNKATAGPLGNNKVDKKDPEVTCGNADGDWHANDVSIGCTASDGGSGLAVLGDASFNLLTSVAANTETANASTNWHDVADAVGHTVTAGPVAGNKVDKKAPAVSCGSADGTWHGNNVAIGCTATDGGSGLKMAGDASFNLVTTVAMGDETSNASTSSKAVLDAVGNSSTAGPVSGNKVDRKAPQVACGTADGLWHASDVSIGCTATDGGSGLADNGDASFNLNTIVAAGTETANASTGSKPVLDEVGNSATAGPVGGNQIDKKGPTLSLTCPNTPLLLNQPASATWNAADGGSGVASGFGTGSFSVPTGTVGPHSATAVAGLSHDNVGNLSTASAPCGYGVNYGFAGFFTPVDPGMNGANSGQAIPLKWTLKDFNGNPVTTLATVTVTATSLTCAQGATVDQLEEYAAGASGLINKGDGSYQFNWKTPTSYAKSCKTLQLNLGDGSPVKTAMFEFKK
jgi:hypothetical protein